MSAATRVSRILRRRRARALMSVTAVLALCSGVPADGRAPDQQQARPSRDQEGRVLTSVQVRDGAVFYVRYGEPGGVLIENRFTAVDTATAVSVDPGEATSAARADRADLPPDLARLVREIIREETARLAADPDQMGQQRAATEPRKGLLDVETGAGLAEIPEADRGDGSGSRQPTVVQVPASEGSERPPGRYGTGPAGGLVDSAAVPSAEVVRRQFVGEGLFRTNLILFETNEARLFPRSREVVRVVGEVLQEYPEARVRIEGHADPRGSADLNWALSQRRADAVRDFLLECCDLAADRLESVGYGEQRPLATGNSPTELAMNRRVEFRILNPEDLEWRPSADEGPATR